MNTRELKERWPEIDATIVKFWGSLGQLLVQHQALVAENAALREALEATKEALATAKAMLPKKKTRRAKK